MEGEAQLVMLSLSGRDPDGRDDEYLRWHLLDHLPEQYSIPQLRFGQRWRLGAGSSSLVGREPFDATAHAVAYFFAGPIDSVPDRFFALGQELYDAGRLTHRLPKVHVGAFEVVGRVTAPHTPARAEVLPMCPYPSLFLLVERATDAPPIDDLVALAGVAGAWQLAGRDLSASFDPSEGLTATLLFVEDPTAVAAAVAGWVASIDDVRRAGLVLAVGLDAVREAPA